MHSGKQNLLNLSVLEQGRVQWAIVLLIWLRGLYPAVSVSQDYQILIEVTT